MHEWTCTTPQICVIIDIESYQHGNSADSFLRVQHSVECVTWLLVHSYAAQPLPEPMLQQWHTLYCIGNTDLEVHVVMSSSESLTQIVEGHSIWRRWTGAMPTLVKLLGWVNQATGLEWLGWIGENARDMMEVGGKSWNTFISLAITGYELWWLYGTPGSSRHLADHGAKQNIISVNLWPNIIEFF